MLVIVPLGLAALLVVAVLAVRFAVRPADTGWVDFASLARPASPNTALACPSGLCTASPDLVTEPVALPAADLAAKVAALAKDEPRVDVVHSETDRFVLVQRSLLFDFPDTVNIAIRPVDAGHATLAIYSRSNYGRGDFGVNLARVKRWLDRLGVPWKAA